MKWYWLLFIHWFIVHTCLSGESVDSTALLVGLSDWHISFKPFWKKCELISQKSDFCFEKGESVNVCHELGEIQVDSDPGRPNVL